MKKLIFILLLLPMLSYGQADAITIILHDSTLWLKNFTTNDSMKLNNRVPSVSGQSGKYITTDGTSILWSATPFADSSVFYTKYRADSSRDNIYSAINGKQASLSGTGFVKSTAGTISYDNSTYLTTASAASTYANDYRAANFVAGTNYLAPNGSAAALTSFPTLNQNTSGTAAGLSAVLSFANGGISASAATSATTGTITVSMTSSVITCTPTGNMTLNASGGVAGQILTFSFTTSGTTSFTITFGTNFRKIGTLATGTTSARFFTVTFRCLDGTTWTEIGRTAAQT